MEATITRVKDDLHLVTLRPPISGFEDFLSAWVLTGRTKAVVDVGPAVTSGQLLAALAALGVDRLDFILLTHIHVDHAGGAGDVARAFPSARVLCHASGIPHLVDPSRLQAGTLKTLGAVGEAYGPITSVPADRLVDAARFENGDLDAILTPGHAVHHVSYMRGSRLFAGEAGGVHLSLPDGASYLRPATPPRLRLDSALRSIDELLARRPSSICYGHYGAADNAVELLRQHRRQLLLWDREIADVAAASDEALLEERCLRRLLQADPLLAGYWQMPPAIRERETGFLSNSIRGFLGARAFAT